MGDGRGEARAARRSRGAERRAAIARRRTPTLGAALAVLSTATPPLLFTENETNTERLFGAPNAGPYVKDAFHDFVVARPRATR